MAPLKGLLGKANELIEQFDQPEEDTKDQPDPGDVEGRKLKSLQKVGIKVLPAAKRYSRLATPCWNACLECSIFSLLSVYVHMLDPLFCIGACIMLNYPGQ